ncbi:glycosyltransferase [Fundidesulfovibrio terrae]|uniref:glycosyltransferase family protein n=1 Tax=Fundidesulfovibrio terrae TaxID=2922866 RepID=UPI001FAECF62|nr:glycosyltransferase [Fundidesulfovibrio terrae]
MRFFQLTTFYDGYLDAFYREHPDVLEMSYADHQRAIIADGFGGGHIIAPYLNEIGYESTFSVVNSRPLQERWCLENGIAFPNWPGGVKELAAAQVAAFDPDVLYLLDPTSYDNAFLKMLPRQPRLVLGWRCASIPISVDWRNFDAILSAWSPCLDTARSRGAGDAIYAIPGFAAFMAEHVRGIPKRHDVVFCGSFTPAHSFRSNLLCEIAEARLGPRGDFDLAFFMLAPTPEAMPEGLARHDHGPRWGRDMYETLASGRIILNAGIDFSVNEAPSMRVLETTGCGSFLLTERHRNISAFFKPGEEVETFEDSEEMLDKIYYYLAHPEERERIAARGQARCLRDYSQNRRARAFDALVRRKMVSEPEASFPADPAALRQEAQRLSGEAGKNSQGQASPKLSGLVKYILSLAVNAAQAGDAGLASELLGIVDATGVEALDRSYCRALLHMARGDAAGAEAEARLEVAAHPENDRARALLSSLLH